MCTSKETQTHADKHFRLYTSFVPWRSCWFLVLKRPSNIADKHFNFTPIIIIWATRWQRHWNVRAFVVWDTTITDGKSSNFSFFMNYKFHIYKCLRKVCFFDRPFTEKAPDQLLWPPLFSSLPFSCLFESNFTEKRGGGIATLSHSFSATLSVVSRLARSRQTSTLWLMNRSGDMNLGDTRTNTLFSFWSSFLCRDWQIRPDVCDVWAKTAACSVWTKSLEYSQTSYRF